MNLVPISIPRGVSSARRALPWTSLALLAGALAGGCADEPVDDAGAGAGSPEAPAPAPAAPTPAAPAPDAAGTETGPAPEPAAAAGEADPVRAEVDSHEIRQSDVDERIVQMVTSQMGRELTPEQVPQFRSMVGPQALQSLIDDQLLAAEIAAKDVEPSEEEYREEYLEQLEVFLMMNNLPREDFEARIMEQEGLTFEQYLDKYTGQEDFHRGVRQLHLLKMQFPEELAITAEELKELYEADRETRWSQPAQVHAAHILFKVPEAPPEAAEAARAKAAEVLELAQAEGADFSALAREHSEGPSAPDGGDLGFFPREGAMVEPFAAAAFALAEGGTSDLVETQFGLHIIRCIERKEAEVVPFETALPAVRRLLFQSKLGEVRGPYLAKLREEAEVVEH